MASGKMKTCKHCGAEIAASAKICPNCGGKNPKPIYKRVWFIILCILVLVGIIGAFAGGGEDASDIKVNDDTEVETTIAEENETEAVNPTADMTTSQANAYRAGLNYLDLMAFSKEGLIKQLSSDYGDGYDREDAEVAVNAIEENNLVDWDEEAKEAAQNYLDTMPFSKDELIQQLESEYGDNFTHEQAVKAVEEVYQ